MLSCLFFTLKWITLPDFKACTILHHNSHESCKKIQKLSMYWHQGICVPDSLVIHFNLLGCLIFLLLLLLKCHSDIRHIKTHYIIPACFLAFHSCTFSLSIPEPLSLIHFITKTKHRHFFCEESDIHVYSTSSLNSVISAARRLRQPKATWDRKPILCASQILFYHYITWHIQNPVWNFLGKEKHPCIID